MKNFILISIVTVLTATVALGADVVTKIDSYTIEIAKTTLRTSTVPELKGLRSRIEAEIVSSERVVSNLEKMLADVDAQLLSAVSLGVVEQTEQETVGAVK